MKICVFDLSTRDTTNLHQLINTQHIDSTMTYQHMTQQIYKRLIQHKA